MSYPRHDPRSWATAGTWSSETRDDALARSPDVARRFFAEASVRFPRIEVRFLRWSVQPGDGYAVFALDGGGFCVQIDADLGYVIVSGPTGIAEYGDWNGDPVPLALAHVAEIVSAHDLG